MPSELMHDDLETTNMSQDYEGDNDEAEDSKNNENENKQGDEDTQSV